METKQTAVQWLQDKLFELEIKIDSKTHEEAFFIFEQAKQMEKEQIIDAYEYGYWRGNNDDDFEPEEYYENPYRNPNNKNYGK